MYSSSGSPFGGFFHTAPLGVPTTIIPRPRPVLEICHLDPGGRGDTTIINVIGNPGLLLLDCASEASAERLCQYITDKPVAYAIISHFDLDHYSGLTAYLKKHRPVEVMTPVSNGDVELIGKVINREKLSLYFQNRVQEMNNGKAKEVVKKLLKSGHKVMAAKSFSFHDAIKMELLSAPDGNAALTMPQHENNNSLRWVISVPSLGFNYYTAGDAEGESFNGNLEKWKNSISVMKLSHHGARTNDSNNRTFLSTTGAKAAIVAGPGGMHGHPSTDVLADAHDLGIATYATGHYSSPLSTTLSEKHVVAGTRQGMGDICVTLWDNGTFHVAWLDEDRTLTIHQWVRGATASEKIRRNNSGLDLMSEWQKRLYVIGSYVSKLSQVNMEVEDIAYRINNFGSDKSRGNQSTSQVQQVATCKLCYNPEIKLCTRCDESYCADHGAEEEHECLDPKWR